MPEFEDRLRSGLAALTVHAPRPTHPRAELDRRLTARYGTPRRMPILAAAAAAVTIAAIAIPIALNQDSPDGGLPPAASQEQRTAAVPSRADVSAYIERPQLITSAGQGADQVHLGMGLDRDGRLCFLALDADEHPISDAVCEPTPTWGAGHMVASRSLSDVTAALTIPSALEHEVADQMVFITAPEVTRLDITKDNGTPVNPTGGWWPQLYWSLADFDGPADGFGYAAYDTDDNLLEQGTI
jgi:hypothetical protein